MTDEKLIAYCGLCCADCHGHKGKIPDLARDLRKELRTSKYEKFAQEIGKSGFGAAFRDYEKCYAVLGAMVRFRCKRGCRNGGGPPQCKIRNCCIKKNIAGCWECADFETCEKFNFLKNVHGDANLKNLRAIKKKGAAEFMKGKREW
jgi:hypothetical protein